MEDNVSIAGSDHEEEPQVKKMSLSKAIYICIKYMFADIFIYGCIFPLVGTYFGTGTANLMGLDGRWEIIVSVSITFSLLYLSFWIFFYEFGFWKHLLALEPFYKKLLLVRDVINIGSLLLSIWFLFLTTKELIAEQKIRSYLLGDGVGYFFLKTLFKWANIDLAHLNTLGFNPPCFENPIISGQIVSVVEQRCTPIRQYELGAAYMFYWTMLSASVAKVVYFSTLYTMTNSMEIFLSLKPVFLDDDEYGGKEFGDRYKSVNFEQFRKISTKRGKNLKAAIGRKESNLDESANANMMYIS